jgi:hypothetical protein
MPQAGSRHGHGHGCGKCSIHGRTWTSVLLVFTLGIALAQSMSHTDGAGEMREEAEEAEQATVDALALLRQHQSRKAAKPQIGKNLPSGRPGPARSGPRAGLKWEDFPPGTPAASGGAPGEKLRWEDFPQLEASEQKVLGKLREELRERTAAHTPEHTVTPEHGYEGEKWNSDGYEGGWHNKMDGQGKYAYHSGDVYEGGWRENKRHGHGKYTWVHGSVCEGEWRMDKQHGQVKCIYESGDVYEGGMRDDQKHGHGKMTHAWDDHGKIIGEIWEGQWKAGMKEGWGKLTRRDSGKVYEGEWHKNVWVGADAPPVGSSTLSSPRWSGAPRPTPTCSTLANGDDTVSDSSDATVAESILGMLTTGTGTIGATAQAALTAKILLKLAEQGQGGASGVTDLEVVSKRVKNKMKGQKKPVSVTGGGGVGALRERTMQMQRSWEAREGDTRLEGDLPMGHGKREGKERYTRSKTYENGDVYEGGWSFVTSVLPMPTPSDAWWDGHGKYTHANGDWYEGQWKDGNKHGQGNVTHTDGETYEGQWVEGEWEGKGKYTSRDGSVYDGEWKKGQAHGRGKCIYSDGSVYEGQWAMDRMEGQGKFMHASGDEYEGQWKAGRKHGPGKLSYVNGDVYIGVWDTNLWNGTSSEHEAVRGKADPRWYWWGQGRPSVVNIVKVLLLVPLFNKYLVSMPTFSSLDCILYNLIILSSAGLYYLFVMAGLYHLYLSAVTRAGGGTKRRQETGAKDKGAAKEARKEKKEASERAKRKKEMKTSAKKEAAQDQAKKEAQERVRKETEEQEKRKRTKNEAEERERRMQMQREREARDWELQETKRRKERETKQAEEVEEEEQERRERKEAAEKERKRKAAEEKATREDQARREAEQAAADRDMKMWKQVQAKREAEEAERVKLQAQRAVQEKGDDEDFFGEIDAALQMFAAETQQDAALQTVGDGGAGAITDDMMCPITLEMMVEPVLAEDGHTYERSAIDDWFARGNRNSPKTHLLIGQRLMPNHSLKALIESIEHSRRGAGAGVIVSTHLSSLPPPHSAELAQWLAAIRPSFASYAPALRECGYEDLSCLRDVDEADFKEALMEVGMDKQGHRAMVLRRFRELI